MRTFYLLFIMALFLYTNSVYSQVSTFDFTSNTTDGTTVTQVVSSVTITVSGSGADLYVASGVGTSGNTAVTGTNGDYAGTTTAVLSFSQAVNITTLRCYEGFAYDRNWNFAPTGGSNSAVNNQNVPAGGATITLNWIGITAITVTNTLSQAIRYGFDNIVMDASLPVELASFTASVSGGKVTLDWQTATEANNYGFEIERKAPLNLPQGETSRMGEWETIGFVQGNGNSNSTKEYSLIDNSPLNGTIQYRLKQIDADGSYSYSDVVEVSLNQQPAKFELQQNYPNPFNPTTTIKFSLPVESMVALEVYNIVGERVASLLSEELNAGYHEIEFDATSLSSGTYFYKLQAGEFVSIKKFILMK